MIRIPILNYLIAALGLSFALVAGEVFLRIADIVHESDPISLETELEDHGGYFKFQPNLAGQPFASASLTTNEFGFRDSEMVLAKQPGTFRIAVIGDSWGAGWGIPEEKSIPSIIKANLRKRFGANRIEVFNFSITGQNLKGYYSLFVSEVVKFNPDYLVVMAHLNDIEPGLFEFAHTTKTEATTSPILYQIQSALKRTKLYKLLYVKLLVPLANYFQIADFGSVSDFEAKYADNSAQYKEFLNYLEKFGAELKSRNLSASAFVLPIPFIKTDSYPLQKINDQVVELYREHNFTTHDLLSVYKGRPRSTLVLHELDGHPNEFAAQILADEMAKKIMLDIQGLHK